MTDLSDYHDMIARKRLAFEPRGFDNIRDSELHPMLFDHQCHGVEFALRTGCAALFYDTGLGKALMALSWGDAVVKRTNKPVLLLAPLAVAMQLHREAEKFGIETKLSRFGQPPSNPCIAITNYERLEKFDPNDYSAVILDESSILKSFNGATTKKLISAFSQTPYRLACTATPAPNDYSELGTHSEFLGALSQTQMLVRWFIHNSADTGTWRMKGHAIRDFWDWVASWSRCVSKPSDLGFSDDGFVLPALKEFRHLVESDRSIDRGEDRDGQQFLFRMPNTSATSIHNEKRLTKSARAEKVESLINAEPDEPWVVWVDADYDAEAVREALPDIVEVSGKMTVDMKEERLDGFSKGEIKRLLTKTKIAGMGLNWQHCARQAFAGLSFSYEAYYQAIRRSWRFGQTRPVHAHVVCADTEAAIWDVVSRKAGDHSAMKAEMAAAMSRASKSAQEMSRYTPHQKAKLPAWLVA